MSVWLFLVSGIMSTFAVSMSHGAYMTHFCSHMFGSRRTQRMYVDLALVNSSKTAVAYLPPTNSNGSSSYSTASPTLGVIIYVFVF